MVAVGKHAERSTEKFVRLKDMLKAFFEEAKTTQRLKVKH